MRALILGFGQDAILMSQILAKNKIDFKIIARRSPKLNIKIKQSGIPVDRFIQVGEISSACLLKLKEYFDFSHIFNFAANSFVQGSDDQFDLFINQNSKILWAIFEVLKLHNELWLFHPLSSEVLSQSAYEDDANKFSFNPRNAYGLSKTLDYYSCQISRQNGFGKIHSCIMFNHESRYKQDRFFSRKLILFFQNLGENNRLNIFNAKSVRDWGSAAEYMEMIFQSSLNKVNETTTLGTGETLSVEDCIDHCLDILSIKHIKCERQGLLNWQGDKILISEQSRDYDDANRIVIANKHAVEKQFGECPQISGKLLISRLLKNEL
jgi:GDPmannose 4,6-dehydratase